MIASQKWENVFGIIYVHGHTTGFALHNLISLTIWTDVLRFADISSVFATKYTTSFHVCLFRWTFALQQSKQRLIVFNSLNLSLECLAVFFFCHVDLITSVSAQRKIKTEMDVGKQLNRRVFVRLAFLIYALKEKGLSYYEIQWQKCSLLSLLPLFFFFPSSFFLFTVTSTSACDCTPSPEVLLDFSLTSCSLNECFNALHNLSFFLENIFQMLGLEHGELDDEHLIVGNKTFLL